MKELFVLHDVFLNLEEFRKNSPDEIKFITKNEFNDLSIETIQKISVILSYAPETELIEKLDNLKYLILFSAGIDQLDLDYYRKNNISIINTHANAKEVAQFAIALLFGLASQFRRFLPITMKGYWQTYKDRLSHPNIDLFGKNVGLIGYGAIARNILSFLQPFNMKFWAIKASSWSESEKNLLYWVGSSSDLFILLSNVDILFITIPLTSETKNFIAEKELALLKPNSLLVNISRAGVINEKALFEVLKDNKIYGAWDHQYQAITNDFHSPLTNYPFNELSNVILSPYRAWINPQSWKNQIIAMCNNLILILNGQTPEDIINQKKY